MKEKIEHSGVVSSVEGEHIRVKIIQHAACSSCKAKDLCQPSESKEKIIDVYDPNASRFSPGDAVRVCGSLSMGKTAVRLAFGIPLVVILVWLITALKVMNLGELTACSILLILLACYFCILRMFDSKISRKFAFWIEEN